ncbi:MAG: CAAX prenyl protease-related protein [Pseudomonadota bacterium]
MTLEKPIIVRALPFALFMLFILMQDLLSQWGAGKIDLRWLYPVKAVLVGALLVYLWREFSELRTLPRSRAWLWLWAPLLGGVVFLLWINLDQGVLNLGDGTSGFDPREPVSGQVDWPLALFRLAGAALVVPVMEELFWRSFLMRWIDRTDFLSASPTATSLRAIAISSLLFGLEHTLWFAGIIAGVAYAWLYRASGSLWPPIIAHATTNGILGVWVLSTGNWGFW